MAMAMGTRRDRQRRMPFTFLLPLVTVLGSSSVGGDDAAKASGRDLLVCMALGLLAGSLWFFLHPRDLVARLLWFVIVMFGGFAIFFALSYGASIESDPRSVFAALAVITGLIGTEAVARARKVGSTRVPAAKPGQIDALP
jgi:hypothetical protein